MEHTRSFIKDLQEILKDKKREDIKTIFENKNNNKTRLVKIAPHKKHPKPISKPKHY